MDECSVADRLDQMRREHGHWISASTQFPHMGKTRHCAITMPCGALRNLQAKRSVPGRFRQPVLRGTTDITRTIALGPVTDEEKEHYTLVLMSMLRLGHVKFLEGCTD